MADQIEAGSFVTVEYEGAMHEFPSDFTDEDISNALIGQISEEPEQKIFHGAEAVTEVEKDEGKLNDTQKHLIELEGFSRTTYQDSKDETTSGVGQRGKFADMTFKDSYDAHVKRAESRVPNLQKFPEFVKQELIQAEYRGDLGSSPKFVKLLNAGNFREAAAEFLDNDDYRDSLEDGSGVSTRMEMVRDALNTLADEQEAAQKEAENVATNDLTPAKGGLFEDDNGVLFMVDDQGNKREV